MCQSALVFFCICFFECDHSIVVSHVKDGEAMPENKRLLSLDVWAIVLSLSLAALVRLGVLKSIPW